MNPRALLALFVLACGDKSDDSAAESPSTSTTTVGSTTTDADGDGFTENEDCDDTEPEVHPAATEVCDGVDNDCDGLTDDADPEVSTSLTWYADADGDGYGDSTAALTACEQPAGHVPDASDCDDDDAAVNPDGEEVCDGIDNDCDDAVDTLDGDADGFNICEDCDDTDPGIHPLTVERCLDGKDNDCDGITDECDPITPERAQAVIRSESSTYGGDICKSGGDMDGDGLEDILIGAPGAYPGQLNEAGAVYVLFSPVVGDVSQGDADVVVYGEVDYTKVGQDVSRAGDISGDGFDDVLLTGAVPGDDYYSVHALFGPLTAMTVGLSEVVSITFGDSSYDDDVRTMVGVGDVDGDGGGDVFFGAAGGTSRHESVAAHLFFSPVLSSRSLSESDLKFYREDEDDGGADSVAGPGDLDGDGLVDLIMRGPSEIDEDAVSRGSAYVSYSSSTYSEGVSLGDVETKFINLTEKDEDFPFLGDGKTGDVNGDGYDDLLFKSPYWGERGGAFLFLGPTAEGVVSIFDSHATFEAGERDGYAGWAASGIGDVNDDDLGDVLVSAPSYSVEGSEIHRGLGDEGSVSLFLGPVTGTLSLDNADLRIHGHKRQNLLGREVSPLNDGDEFLVGAGGGTGAADGGGGSGCYLFNGSDL